MIALLEALGSGISTNLLSDSLVRKLDAFKGKKAIESFVHNLSEWEIEFEKQNDGTIATSSEFYSYIKYNNVIGNIITYVLDPSNEDFPEDVFLNDFQAKIVRSLEESTAKKLSQSDSTLIRDFLVRLTATTKTFLFERISLEDRGLFYLICQSNAKISHLEQTIKEKFQMQDQIFQHILEQLSIVIQKAETEDVIKAKVISWNSRQIKNLGNRYTPDLNIPLKIMDSLHGASIDQQFRTTFFEKVDSLLIAIRDANFNELNVYCDTIEKIVTELDFFSIAPSDLEAIISSVNAIETFLNAKIEEYHEEKKNYDSKAYQLFKKLGAINEFKDYILDTPVRGAVSPYIVLVGDGGVGKSHLIADYIENCNSSCHTSLLLLGQQFSAGTDILASLPGLLGCDITYHELFTTLESIARAQQCRVLICIDALNEGAGVAFWNYILSGFVDYVKGYPHIGLLVSVRTQYEDALFDGQDILKGKMLRIEHLGFTSIEHDTMHRYFSFYGITIDSVVFPITEFRNSLFLRLFCVANANKHISLENISLPSVYSQYIDVMEERVSKRCGYHKSYKLVSKIINAMVSKRADGSKSAITLPLDDTLEIIVDICKNWNVTADVYGALLTEGVLTQGIAYDGTEYVYITYERLEDYFLAEKIVLAYSLLNEDEFFEKYSWITNKPDLFQFFGIILAENWEYELCDVFSSDKFRNSYLIRNAFLYGLLWRKAASITTHTREYINSEILQYQHSFRQFIDVLFALSARPNHPLNAQNSFSFFQRHKMPDRDAVFIPVFDELFDNHNSALYRFVEWGLIYASKQAVTDDVAEKCATILSWLLISPNNELRDKATKAIICILNSHMVALLSLLQAFEGIDDPYISERIYGIAFGCVVNEDSPQQVRALAEHVYSNIFDKDVVFPNILLRTYAKNIIDYARHIGCVEDGYFDAGKITPPYNSEFPEIPSDEEIKTYKLDYNSESFKTHHWSQLAILSSMKVEHSRSGQPGGYGDFGRYTFQSYFHAWKQLHPMDLKNIAIKRIFDLGYDVEKHGKYDQNCTNHVSLGTQPGKKERIGKKYQWIALYELAAQVGDNYTMTAYDDDTGEPHQEYCKGSFEPNIRNIDPTVLATPNYCEPHIDGRPVSYITPNNSYDEWLSGFSDAPPFEQCIKLQHGDKQYLLLTGGYDWKETKRLGFRSYDLPRKDMWHQIRGYFVKDEHVSSLLQSLAGVDFMGRWMPEAHSNSSMYNKEFYWSDAHDFFENPYYCGSEWVNIDSYYLNCSFQGKVLIPVNQYFSERKGELNTLKPETPSIYWHKPCDEIYRKLQLSYLKGSNSAFVDRAGELVCFDSSELLDNDIGFYIRYDKLLEFVESSGYTLVWTSLSEKQVLAPSFGEWDLPPKAIHMSSVYYLKDGKIIKASEAFFEDKLYR